MDRMPIQDHCAGATVAGLAAVLDTDAASAPNRVQQGVGATNGQGPLLAVYRQRDFGLFYPNYQRIGPYKLAS